MKTREEMKAISAEIDAKVIELLPTGMKYEKIARIISAMGEDYIQTRKAVTGRVYRMTKNGTIPKRAEVLVNKKAKTSANILLKSKESYKLEDWNKHGVGTVDILDLKNDMCRFPFENGKYCGCVSVIGSYCLTHSLVCHRDNGKRVR